MPAKNTKIEATVDETVADETVKKDHEVWTVKVDGNTSFCGIGAGGVQFANGEANITSKRMAEWFTEHDGYTVTHQ